MIGNTIGDYRILEKRGEGGMGMFFKARDIRLDRLVGLKTIRAELLHDPEVIGRLEEEARSLARLDHPNIARLLHYMVIDDQRYIVMEYVEGSDLSDRLRHDGPLPLELMARLVPQICAAIGYAHNRHVIHRDIKPSNILLTEDGTVKVTDFGIAKILGVSTKTRTGVATGSLPYMAPEQIRGKVIDARTDIYQSGVMLFELIVGRRPFLAETEYDMMSHHLSTPPPVPTSIKPGIPRAMDSVLLKALSKDPASRYASAAELADAFRLATTEAAEPRTIHDVSPGTANSAHDKPSTKSKRLRLVGAIAIGLLAVMAFAKVFLLEGRRSVTSSAPLVEVSVLAKMPTELPAMPKVSERLTVQYLTSGMRKSIFYGDQPDLNPPVYDSLSLETTCSIAPQDNFRQTLWLNAGDSVRFSLAIIGPNGENVCEGTSTSYFTSETPTPHRLDIPMKIPSFGALTQSEPRALLVEPSEHSMSTNPSSDGSRDMAGQLSNENLTIDVQPFANRDRIELLWIDGNRQSAQLPFKLHESSGLHTIRWQSGADVWTDTVTVGESPIEKILTIDLSRGRINVTVTFPDGPGYAEILLDGKETGQGTPGELRNVASGPHEITLRRAGYRMQGGPVIVRVPANDRVRVAIPMGPR